MFTPWMPNLYSADLAAAADFYRDVLGFSQTYQFPPAGPPAHVELRLGDSRLALSSHAAVRQTGLAAPSAGHAQELVDPAATGWPSSRSDFRVTRQSGNEALQLAMRRTA